MKILEEIRARRDQQHMQTQDLEDLVAAIPYAKFLGLQIDRQGDEVITVLPFEEHLVGNVNLPALHGGAVGALLEITAVLQLIYDTGCERLPKTVDVSFDYLRSATAKTTYGRAIVTRQGRRAANVRCELWQDHRDKPVALGHGHYLLAPLNSNTET